MASASMNLKSVPAALAVDRRSAVLVKEAEVLSTSSTGPAAPELVTSALPLSTTRSPETSVMWPEETKRPPLSTVTPLETVSWSVVSAPVNVAPLPVTCCCGCSITGGCQREGEPTHSAAPRWYGRGGGHTLPVPSTVNSTLPLARVWMRLKAVDSARSASMRSRLPVKAVFCDTSCSLGSLVSEVNTICCSHARPLQEKWCNFGSVSAATRHWLLTLSANDYALCFRVAGAEAC